MPYMACIQIIKFTGKLQGQFGDWSDISGQYLGVKFEDELNKGGGTLMHRKNALQST